MTAGSTLKLSCSRMHCGPILSPTVVCMPAHPLASPPPASGAGSGGSGIRALGQRGELRPSSIDRRAQTDLAGTADDHPAADSAREVNPAGRRFSTVEPKRFVAQEGAGEMPDIIATRELLAQPRQQAFALSDCLAADRSAGIWAPPERHL